MPSSGHRIGRQVLTGTLTAAIYPRESSQRLITVVLTTISLNILILYIILNICIYFTYI